MRVQVVDPSAYTPPYDHALCTALAHTGAEVELITSAFAYGSAPPPDGYVMRELFYRRALGPAGSRTRRVAKLLEHVPDMLRYRRVAEGADVVHFQWLPMQWLDRRLLPAGPIVLTAHDLLPREPRVMQVHAQRRLYGAVDAVVAHSDYGRGQLVDRLGVDPGKVRVIHHGAFEYLTEIGGAELPPELAAGEAPVGQLAPGEAPVGQLPPGEAPVVLFFGLLRPHKGIDVLLKAWRGIDPAAQLWIVGRPRMALEPLRTLAPPGVRFVPRYVSDPELAACFRRADVVVLPYSSTERFDFSGVLAAALAFGKPSVLTAVGGFPEVAATGAAQLVPPRDAGALRAALAALIGDPGERDRLARAARSAADGPYSWERAARQTVTLYRELVAGPLPQSAPP